MVFKKMSIHLEKTLLPKNLILRLHTEKKEENVGEKAMCAVALLLINTVSGTIKVLRQRNYKNLDANPGDGGCQNRALELKRLTLLENLNEECQRLEKTAKEIKSLLNKRNSNQKEREKCSSHLFFESHFGSLTISKEMEYLVHCYLSTVLRTPCQRLPNGVVLTKSEMSKLSILSNKITVLDTFTRRKIVEENQKNLSELSVKAMHQFAMQVTSLDPEEKKLMVTMLSPEHTHFFSPDINNYEPKAFGCLFYEIKTVLIRLREEQGMIALKSIVSQGNPFHLLLQAKISGNEFELVADESYTSLSSKERIVVFEAVVKTKKEETGKLLMEYGFTNIILAQAANEAPYEPTSTFNDIKVIEASNEMTRYKEMGLKFGDFIALDHVYLNTLDAELN